MPAKPILVPVSTSRPVYIAESTLTMFSLGSSQARGAAAKPVAKAAAASPSAAAAPSRTFVLVGEHKPDEKVGTDPCKSLTVPRNLWPDGLGRCCLGAHA